MEVKMEVKVEVKMDRCIVVAQRIVPFNSLFNSPLKTNLHFNSLYT